MRSARRSLSITREPAEEGFCYYVGGRRIKKLSELERIASLTIPPAWSAVEISRSPSSKILARGVDAAGRTQTIYHPSFRRKQDRAKFDRMLRFANRLPRIRAKIDRDLRSRRLSRKRVTACVIHLIDDHLFRVGNQVYADRNGSFGITTLRDEHLEVTSTMVEVNFVGKSGKHQHRRIRDPRAARLLAQLMQLSGPEVFSFIDEEDSVQPVKSRHINAYVKRTMGREFSAKDFRTWGGTVTVAAALIAADPSDLSSDTARLALLREAIDLAADRLGNTREITKSSYVHPKVLAAVEHPELLEQVRRTRFRARRHLTLDEQRTLALITTK